MLSIGARLLGRFENAVGAHAGFGSGEHAGMLGTVFAEVNEMTGTYFHVMYKAMKRIVMVLEVTELSNVVYPGIYFMARKKRK